MATLQVYAVTAAGVDPTPSSAAAGGDDLSAADVLTGRCWIEVVNGHSAAQTVSVADPGKTASGNPGTITPVSVPASGGKRRIYVPPSAVNPTTGKAALTYSGVTALTVLALRV
jgi:hypothetical protein